MKYSFKNLSKALFTWFSEQTPNPYTNKELPTPMAYKKYVINFPDGVVTTDKEFTNIPDYTTWTEPMVELFLLIVKDWRNWEETIKQDSYSWRLNRAVRTHSITGTTISYPIVNRHNKETQYECSIPFITYREISEVVALSMLWKEVHYGDKLERIARIKQCKGERIKNKARSEEAKKIREYLEGVVK